MANELRGEIEVEIGGRKLPLRVEHDALEFLEAKYGYVLHEVAMLGESGGLKFKTSFVMDTLHVGLRHLADKRLTMGWLRKNIPIHDLPKYVPPVMKVLILALRGPEALRDIEDAEREAEAAEKAKLERELGAQEGAPGNPPDSPGASGSP
jgi:hypothetical protein